MREPAEQFVAAIFDDDRLRDHSAQPRHALAKPRGDAPAVQGKIGTARAAPHQAVRIGKRRAGAVERSAIGTV